MMLFENTNYESVYLAGDDGSGTDYNSMIGNWILHGRTYDLWLRLYYDKSEHGAVMFWLFFCIIAIRFQTPIQTV
jgi:hypothetical protein